MHNAGHGVRRPVRVVLDPDPPVEAELALDAEEPLPPPSAREFIDIVLGPPSPAGSDAAAAGTQTEEQRGEPLVAHRPQQHHRKKVSLHDAEARGAEAVRRVLGTSEYSRQFKKPHVSSRTVATSTDPTVCSG